MLHQSNCTDENERYTCMRSTQFVPELCGRVNTQVVEQLNKVIGKCKYFLNMMGPGPHMFVLRLIGEIINRDRNQNMLEAMTKAMGEVCQDKWGRYRPKDIKGNIIPFVLYILKV